MPAASTWAWAGDSSPSARAWAVPVNGPRNRARAVRTRLAAVPAPMCSRLRSQAAVEPAWTPWSAPAAPRASTAASQASQWPSTRLASRRSRSTPSARATSVSPSRPWAAIVDLRLQRRQPVRPGDRMCVRVHSGNLSTPTRTQAPTRKWDNPAVTDPPDPASRDRPWRWTAADTSLRSATLLTRASNWSQVAVACPAGSGQPPCQATDGARPPATTKPGDCMGPDGPRPRPDAGSSPRPDGPPSRSCSGQGSSAWWTPGPASKRPAGRVPARQVELERHPHRGGHRADQLLDLFRAGVDQHHLPDRRPAVPPAPIRTSAAAPRPRGHQLSPSTQVLAMAAGLRWLPVTARKRRHGASSSSLAAGRPVAGSTRSRRPPRRDRDRGRGRARRKLGQGAGGRRLAGHPGARAQSEAGPPTTVRRTASTISSGAAGRWRSGPSAG